MIPLSPLAAPRHRLRSNSQSRFLTGLGCPGRLLLCGLLLSVLISGCGQSEAIVVITPHPTKSNILYIATNGYIYKSRDGGQTWQNMSKGMSFSRVISMAIDPQYPATIYAGTKGDAVYKSYDGGQRWVSKRTGLDSVTISSVVNQLLFDPDESRRMFAATTMGIFESRDAGDTWQKRMDGMKEVLMVITLALDPNRPTSVYAGTSGGVYKSVDRAMHWEKANNGLVSPDILLSSRALGVTVILVDPYNSRSIYAATLNGIYKSTDEARSWSRIAESLPDQMISAMVLDRSQPGVVFVASRQGVHKSSDGGKSWKAVIRGLGSLNIRSLVQSPTDPQILYAGTNGSGLYRSRDRGETWDALPPIRP